LFSVLKFFSFADKAGKEISRGMWLYFLAMVNSLGIFNFFAYGFSEKLYDELKSVMCGGGSRSSKVDSVRPTYHSSAKNSIDLESSSDKETSLP
jgi:hypothetical protein